MCIRDRPSTEISENLVKYKDSLYCEWSPNEKVATEVAIGASVAGVRAMSCMKHVGFNVAADPTYTVSYMGVNGGLVIVVADDPGLYSSQNEQDTRMVARAAQLPVIEPSDSSEAKEFIKVAYDLNILKGLSSYKEWTRRSEEIGRMIGGFINTVNGANSDADNTATQQQKSSRYGNSRYKRH